MSFRTSNTVLFLLLIFLSTVGQITSDLYLPSLPYITASLMTSNNVVQLTVSVYMFTFGLSQLFYGPYSDSVGRRKPVLFGIMLSIIGSIICTLAPTIDWLIIGRALQGLGTGAGIALSRTILRDTYSGTQLAKFSSYLVIFNTFIMASAPTLGGYIQTYLGWRSNFIFLLFYTSIAWALLYTLLPETNPIAHRHSFKFSIIYKNFKLLLNSKLFIGYVLCACFSYAGIIAYVTASPFLLQNLAGLTPIQFGWLAFVVAAAFVSGGFSNAKLVIRLGIPKLMFFGVSFMLLAGAIMLIFGILGHINTFVIIFPIALFLFGSGFVFANSFAGAFTPFPKIAGAAAALFGCIQILGGSLASAAVASLPDKNQIPLAAILITLSVLTMFALKFLAMPRNRSKLHS